MAVPFFLRRQVCISFKQKENRKNSPFFYAFFIFLCYSSGCRNLSKGRFIFQEEIMKYYYAGMDIGSTTVKLVILDSEKHMVFGRYCRHNANTREALAVLLREAQAVIGDSPIQVSITGSGSINLAKALKIGFVQEVVAVAAALKAEAPQTDVAIELGGEDAKIIYFTGGLEQRMNGVCAGGTGSFIDQMAALMQTDAAGLNEAAAEYQRLYPIAARCGVFAKTDVQPLINEGASKADLAASIFQAVVNQTISGLACGKPIRGNVAFLGGPLHFLPELKKAFIRTLKLTPETTVDPDNSHLFAAMGAALEAEDSEYRTVSSLLSDLNRGLETAFEMPRLPALFTSEAEYRDFQVRHEKAKIPRGDISGYSGDCFLGIDAGSTTTKLALIGEDGQLLYSFYSGNQGSPVEIAKTAIRKLQEELPPTARIARSCSTGYGEALLKSAFSLDEGEVETIAHATAAKFFSPEVDCILDIGGQDMKCIRLRNGAVDSILLNEACSSGCGSFIENFAVSMNCSVQEFARVALFAKNPVDLGTRCTVFMNSNVKQAQKEGASLEDISAGLSYSVIKNALYKVIKLTSPEDLGKHIVVQGGTFHNHGVLRAFETIAGVEATCPDIAGLMGAFGAALIARNHYHGQQSHMLPMDQIPELTYTTRQIRCGGCQNNCMLTVNTFPGGKRHITGNRCEKGGGAAAAEKAPNMVSYKYQKIFGYTSLDEKEAHRGTIGIPRILNIYENYPFWHTFFTRLGFRVVLSPDSSRKLYELGMDSIPSESECYPAKMSHGHVQWLIGQGVHTIFHPCVFYEHQETKNAQNHYNCPIVVSYAENLKNNVEAVSSKDVHYLRPFIAFTSEKTVSDRLVRLCREEWDIPEKEVRHAAAEAWQEQCRSKEDIRREGQRRLEEMRAVGGQGIVLAGRPYHVDPEINHGIPELIASYGFYVFTEDSMPLDPGPDRALRVVDQWVYHSRLYNAASYVRHCEDLELIQLNSFGCGLDAVTTDQVKEILECSNKLYTLLKIDEIANLGAVRIRIRSLLAAIRERKERRIVSQPAPISYQRAEFTKEMKEAGYTILAPQMSPIHFALLEPVFCSCGYHIEILGNDNRNAIDMGLKFVNNDACYPSILVIGQIMDAVLSGKYDTDRLAIMMTQTGGCCRASNYIAFIHRALDKAGLSHIPVISLNANGMEKNEGFKLSLKMLRAGLRAVVYGDLLMKCIYHVRPYELETGSVEALHKKWNEICIDQLTNPHTKYRYEQVCRGIVSDFDTLPLDESVRKPRVGIVGEILVKYMPLANNHLVDLLEKEGAEVVVPDLLDFFAYSLFDEGYKSEFLGTGRNGRVISRVGVDLLETLRKPATNALKASRRFEPTTPIQQLADATKPFLSIGNQYGEGWFLTGEMLELINSGTPNIVCIQPFACLPNHVVGKGVIKQLKKVYSHANIAAVDYDPGASEVNQLNRIKLMLSVAKNNLKDTEGSGQG